MSDIFLAIPEKGREEAENRYRRNAKECFQKGKKGTTEMLVAEEVRPPSFPNREMLAS
jgi:hypothetical protein